MDEIQKRIDELRETDTKGKDIKPPNLPEECFWSVWVSTVRWNPLRMLPVYKPKVLVWNIPQSWKDWYIDPKNFDNANEQHSQQIPEQIESIVNEQDGRVLQAWSLSCEKAVSQTLRIQHKLDSLKGQWGVPLTVYPWYLLCSLGILGDNLPINTHEL